MRHVFNTWCDYKNKKFNDINLRSKITKVLKEIVAMTFCHKNYFIFIFLILYTYTSFFCLIFGLY